MRRLTTLPWGTPSPVVSIHVDALQFAGALQFFPRHRAPYNARLDRLSADLDAKGYHPAPARHRADA